MIIKLTSAVKKAVPSAPDRHIYINTHHLLKMGQEPGPGTSDSNFIYPHTNIAMIGSPDVVVIEDPDTIMRASNG